MFNTNKGENMFKESIWKISGHAFRRSLAAVTLAIAFAAATSKAEDAKVPSDKSRFHIFVLMGQSNMAGSGLPVLPEYVKADPKVLVINGYFGGMNWTEAKINFGDWMGPGQVFARHYAELHPGVTVGLIQCAIGGTPLQKLMKGGSKPPQNYDTCVAKIKEAMKLGTVKGILWHHGESNNGDAGYVEKLKSFVSDVRTEYWGPEHSVHHRRIGQICDLDSKFQCADP